MSQAATLFLLGASHHTAPLELREKIALTGDKLEALRGDLRGVAGLKEYAVLDTCNRVEIYGVAAGAGTIDRVQAAFCARHGMEPANFEKIRLKLGDREVVEHLLGVAAGLDSQMIGETEILGQLKEAYAEAQQKTTTGPVLNRLFQKTFQAAKHVRTHTGIGAGQVNAATVAVDLAIKIFGTLEHGRVLLVGAGEMGGKTVRALKSRGVAHLTVAARREERAKELAAAFECNAISFERVRDTLAEYDVVVCCTSSPDPVVTRGMAASAIRRRPLRPLFLIDLAVPRDVDPAAAGLPNVFLYNLDDLAKIAGENLAQRKAEVARAQVLIKAKVEHLWPQMQERLAATPPPPA
ncbi:MAG: glutamyl-tRNA reductase [Verrucomicrobia bacterium RIFCSPLOWO2_12_FULL_64_8]|nr:MAG: glutamyl-tRNA reductase [Verrucomicrobia bacterium RIFCSPLOWO2_12_FULL_64_8]